MAESSSVVERSVLVAPPIAVHVDPLSAQRVHAAAVSFLHRDREEREEEKGESKRGERCESLRREESVFSPLVPRRSFRFSPHSNLRKSFGATSPQRAWLLFTAHLRRETQQLPAIRLQVFSAHTALVSSELQIAHAVHGRRSGRVSEGRGGEAAGGDGCG
eukprot:656939-Rhodomonas_salina.2